MLYVPGLSDTNTSSPWNKQQQQFGIVQRQHLPNMALTSPILCHTGGPSGGRSHSYYNPNRLGSPIPSPLHPMSCHSPITNPIQLIASPANKSPKIAPTANKPLNPTLMKTSKETSSRTHSRKDRCRYRRSVDSSGIASYASRARRKGLRCRHSSNASMGGSTIASESDAEPNTSDWRSRLASLFSLKAWAKTPYLSAKPDDSGPSGRQWQDTGTGTRSRFVDCWESCSPCISVEAPLPRRGFLSSADVPTTIDIMQREDLRRLELLKDKLKRVQRRINQREEDRIMGKHHGKHKTRNDHMELSLLGSSSSRTSGEMSAEEGTRISGDDLSFVQFVRNFATSSPVKPKDVHPSFPAKIFTSLRRDSSAISEIRWAPPRENRRGNCAVFLRVYDISEGMAKSWSRFLICSKVEGIWHSGLMAFGYEYFYCDGVMRMLPRDVEETYAMNLRKVHYLGETSRAKHEFERFLSKICSIFSEDTYDILEWNCNDFTNLCSLWLVGGANRAVSSRHDSDCDPSKLSSVQECRFRRMQSICGVMGRGSSSPRDYHFIPSYVLEQPETLERLPVGKLALACVRLTNRNGIRRKIDEAINHNDFAIMCRNTVLRMKEGMANAVSIVRTETAKTVQRPRWCC